MAGEVLNISVVADVAKYIQPLAALPGVSKQAAERAAIAISTGLGKVEGAAAEATAKVVAYNKSLVDQGVSSKVAASASLKYAQTLAAAAPAAKAADTAVVGFGAKATQAAERTGNLGMAIGGVGQQLSDVASQLATGTNPFTILVQQGPQVASSISMAGFGLSSVLSILGPLAIALGTVAAAYAVVGNATFDAAAEQNAYTASAESAIEASNRIAAALARVSTAQAKTRDSTTESGMKLAEMSGLLADYEVAAISAGQAVEDGAADEIAARQEANVIIGRRLDLLRRAIAADATDSAQKPAMIAQERELAAAYAEGVAGLRGLIDATTRRSVAMQQAVVDEGRAKEAEEAAERARRAHEKAIRAQEEALRKLSAAMQAENDLAEKNARQYQGALDGLASIAEANRAVTRTEGERIEATRRATEESIREREREALAVTSTQSGIESIYAESERARAEAHAAYTAQLTALDKQRTEKAEELAQKQVEIEQRAFNSRLQLASTLAAAIGTIAQTAGDNMTDEQKKAAQVIFAIQKTAALAQIGLNTILAVSNASTSAPPPYNAIPMAIAAASGAASFAAAAAAPPPKFHSGTLSAGTALRSDEFSAVLQRGEAVIPAATMQQPGAKEQAAALVSGRSPVAASEVARGMDGSSIPVILSRIERALLRPAPRSSRPRPGHRPRTVS